jgi:hypothetical protein
VWTMGKLFCKMQSCTFSGIVVLYNVFGGIPLPVKDVLQPPGPMDSTRFLSYRYIRSHILSSMHCMHRLYPVDFDYILYVLDWIYVSFVVRL